MNIQELLTGNIGNELINGLSQQTGAEESKVSQVISLALPFMLEQMKRNTSSTQGAENLNNALDNHQGSVLDNISDVLNNSNTADGLGILTHIFGNKQNNIIENISKSSGISSENVMQILATLAPVVMSFLGKQKQQSDLDSSGVAGLLGKILNGIQQSNLSEMSTIKKILDGNGDASIAGKALDLGSKLLGGFSRK